MITIAFLKNFTFQYPLSSISLCCVECIELSYCFNFFRDWILFHNLGPMKVKEFRLVLVLTPFLFTCLKTCESNFA